MAASGMADAQLHSQPYEEPSLITILVLGSFLLLLNLFRGLLQRLVSAGLLGELILGAIYSAPLADILPSSVQSAVLSLGYLGLMLLIVEGGLDTRLDVLGQPRNLILGLLAGLTGIGLPIGLSLLLLPVGYEYSILESFAVGAALSATSLGTTFAVISSFGGQERAVDVKEQGNGQAAATTTTRSEAQQQGRDGGGARDQTGEAAGLIDTRVGSILVGAALLDDIIGLVISSVVSNLGSDSGSSGTSVGDGRSTNPSTSIAPWTAARPIVSSFLLLSITALLSRFVLAPFARKWSKHVPRLLIRLKVSNCAAEFGTLAFVSVIAIFATIAHYVGSSILIGCFCAGAMMSHTYHALERSYHSTTSNVPTSTSIDADVGQHLSLLTALSPHTTIGLISPVQRYILAPFFFASVGAAIPVRSLFEGQTVWRGILFAGLMGAAKLVAGAWLLAADAVERRVDGQKTNAHLQLRQLPHAGTRAAAVGAGQSSTSLPGPGGGGARPRSGSIASRRSLPAILGAPVPNTTVPSSPCTAITVSTANTSASPPWPPALFLGLTLVARGEIGFLILNVALQRGLLSVQSFNVGVWAVVLNTLVGPFGVGWLLKSSVGAQIAKGRWGAQERR